MLLEVQADKTALDVPSPAAGRVTDVRVKVGEQIKVGQVICLLEGGGNGEAPKARGRRRRSPPKPRRRRSSRKRRRKPRRRPPGRNRRPRPSPRRRTAVNRLTPAGPATRRLARELGVDLTQVAGSGRAGRVVEEDVKAFVRQLASGGVAPGGDRRRAGGAAAAQLRAVGAGRASTAFGDP